MPPHYSDLLQYQARENCFAYEPSYDEFWLLLIVHKFTQELKRIEEKVLFQLYYRTLVSLS